MTLIEYVSKDELLRKMVVLDQETAESCVLRDSLPYEEVVEEDGKYYKVVFTESGDYLKVYDIISTPKSELSVVFKDKEQCELAKLYLEEEVTVQDLQDVSAIIALYKKTKDDSNL